MLVSYVGQPWTIHENSLENKWESILEEMKVLWNFVNVTPTKLYRIYYLLFIYIWLFTHTYELTKMSKMNTECY